MAFKTSFETPEAEAARLAQSPVDSENHELSTLPVNIHGVLKDGMLIRIKGPRGDYVVTPITSHPIGSLSARAENRAAGIPTKRYQRTWDCITVASNDPRIPVGGNRISLPEYKLVRGTLHTIEL